MSDTASFACQRKQPGLAKALLRRDSLECCLVWPPRRFTTYRLYVDATGCKICKNTYAMAGLKRDVYMHFPAVWNIENVRPRTCTQFAQCWQCTGLRVAVQNPSVLP